MEHEHILWEDVGRGAALVIEKGKVPPDIHFRPAGIYETKEDALREIARRRKATETWVVFANEAEQKGWVSLEDCYSGNWRGSLYSPYTVYGEHRTQEQALEQLRALEEEWGYE